MKETMHFRDMLKERSISNDWVTRTVDEADKIEDHDDGTRHYLKQIVEHENRWLRIVVNINEHPNRKVTAFFDRRLGRKNENKG